MAGKSDYLENKLLDKILGATDFTPPATVYIALYTVAPTDSGGGTEVTGGAYARQAVTNNTTNWPNAAGGSKSNGAVIQFAEATANWGTVVAAAILDAATGGNLLYYGDLTTSRVVNTGDQVRFAIGGLVVSED